MRRDAAILATLCLNFAFWFDNGTLLWLPVPGPVSALLVALIAAAVAAVFFAGPALAVLRNGNGLFATVEASLGRIPAHLIRFCALWYLVDWVAELLSRASYWALPGILKRDPANTEFALFELVILAFLTATAHESRLARFSIRLSIAVLIACAIRVRESPAYLTGPIESLEWSLNRLALGVAPMAFLAANLGARLQSSRHVLSTAALGLALPLWVSVFLVGLVNMATFHSRFYQPSNGPTIAMALMGGVSSRAIPALLLIVTITLFGPIRLGLQLLRTTLPPILAWPGLLAIAASVSGVTISSIYFQKYFLPAIPATILATTAAVLAAGLILPPKGKMIANLALLAGAIVGGHNIREPEILPAYATAFVLTLAGRKLQSILPAKPIGSLC